MRNETRIVRDYIPQIFNGGYEQIRIVSSGGYWQYYNRGNDIPNYYWDFEVFYTREEDERIKTLTIYLK